MLHFKVINNSTGQSFTYSNINKRDLLGQIKYILQWTDFQVIEYSVIPTFEYMDHNCNN